MMTAAINKLIQCHRSVRNYLPREVEEEKLNRILENALRASSSGNMQSFSIIVTKNEEIKRRLYKPHFEQQMVLDAPLFLTFCADFNRMRKWLKINNAPLNFDNMMSFMIGGIDAILASANAALSAEAEGLGICYLGTTLASCDEIADILECPNHVVPVVGFSLGYADYTKEDAILRDRLPLSSIVHYDKYHNPTNDDIVECYKDRDRDGWKRYMENERLKKLVLESGVQNLAQVYTQVKYTKESHEQYSKNIFNCLKKRGFIEN